MQEHYSYQDDLYWFDLPTMQEGWSELEFLKAVRLARREAKVTFENLLNSKTQGNLLERIHPYD